MDTNEAARRLGVPVAEIVDVLDAPAGIVIVTTDGASYVDVVEPDGAGRTGLMYLAAPTERYSDTFPVYTAPEPDEPITDELDGARVTEPAVPTGIRQPDLDERDALDARARELGIKFRKNTSTATLAKLVADAEAAAATPVVDPAQAPIVGESGPETIVPTTDGTVVPAGAPDDDPADDDDPAAPLTDDEQLIARAGALGIDVDQFELDELAELVAKAEADADAAGGDDA